MRRVNLIGQGGKVLPSQDKRACNTQPLKHCDSSQAEQAEVQTFCINLPSG